MSGRREIPPADTYPLITLMRQKGWYARGEDRVEWKAESCVYQHPMILSPISIRGSVWYGTSVFQCAAGFIGSVVSFVAEIRAHLLIRSSLF